MIRIIIADRHRLFRQGLQALFAREVDIEVVGMADTGQEVLRLLATTRAHIVLMQVEVAAHGRYTTLAVMQEAYPDCSVLALATRKDKLSIKPMLQAGAQGYLFRSSSFEELCEAIRQLAAGNCYYSQDVSAAIVDDFVRLPAFAESVEAKSPAQLTKREREVLILIAEGLSNTEIANTLYISIRTVDTHRRNILEKLGLKNTAGMVRYAIRHRMVVL